MFNTLRIVPLVLCLFTPLDDYPMTGTRSFEAQVTNHMLYNLTMRMTQVFSHEGSF